MMKRLKLLPPEAEADSDAFRRLFALADENGDGIDNLEYGLLNYTEKGSICVLFDADHHPRPNTIRGLVSILLQSPDLVAVQGAVLIERNGPWIMRRLLDGMEWSSWSFYAPGFAEIVGSGYFGGGNAAWRVETLHSLGFDGTMLTEDIDIVDRVDDRLEEKQCVQVFDEVEAIAAVLQQECRKREKEDNSLLDAMLYGQAKLQHSVLSAFGADAEDRA